MLSSLCKTANTNSSRSSTAQVSFHGMSASLAHTNLLPILPVYSVTHPAGSDRATLAHEGERQIFADAVQILGGKTFSPCGRRWRAHPLRQRERGERAPDEGQNRVLR